MEERVHQKGITAAFPPPPPFWTHFTPSNLEKLEETKRDAVLHNTKGDRHGLNPEDLRALDLPTELRYLVPPKPPNEGQYSLFSELQSVSLSLLQPVDFYLTYLQLSTSLPSLQQQGIEQLYPSDLTDETTGRSSRHAYYLLKISKSLLLNFLELVGILSLCPDQYEPKLDDIRNLFINAHHLLNSYRPHQSRESLIAMMEEQLERAKEEIQEMDQMKTRAEMYLRDLEMEGHSASHGVAVTKTMEQEADSIQPKQSEHRENTAHAMWELLDEIE
ncbi:Mediator of RNA polymerase II transcription subunit 7 [Ophidiomyces ophidiicola]|uniref:Mediator of RNA polymerase II transcription subunit 7 n=1 Tax=Ophidiomyces ophidiicola TaxID=1387563 RepID=A0ACB8V397_9EURO|nr:Mediator of RNA polymerase II transcription subunit 7 [Ophidiomyces ophidiicola]KAI1954689.1 Mediator of RNA polymerase II transcription subunit 7 [Ophidiomyces ophidiicola]KAI1958499.1 Mediator of RNA polymerase II transcription subunit 7 [Ophidiomyces ophidiicola]KAI2007589.1 Mediator of RNA polymerase II transcription subunit 7 [Ophidiomyces ophidiicola]KAI2017967.1 Mediator of RNA polymerase II transcription subunit 7 [Ophidiomyces ophidiicola]